MCDNEKCTISDVVFFGALFIVLWFAFPQLFIFAVYLGMPSAHAIGNLFSAPNVVILSLAKSLSFACLIGSITIIGITVRYVIVLIRRIILFAGTSGDSP